MTVCNTTVELSVLRLTRHYALSAQKKVGFLLLFSGSNQMLSHRMFLVGKKDNMLQYLCEICTVVIGMWHLS